MRLLHKLALASALATASFSIAAAPAFAKDKKEDSAPKLKNSKKFVEAYLVVDGFIQSGDIASAKTAAEAALAAIENDDDKLVAGQMMLTIADKTDPKDAAFAIRGYDLLLASTSLSAQDRPVIAFNAGRMAYSLKDYAKTIAYMELAKTAGMNSPDLLVIDGHSRLNLDDTSGFETMRAAVSGKRSAGEVPPEQWLRLAAGAAERLKNDSELIYWTRAWVQFYPTQANWRLALGIYIDRTEIPQDAAIDMFRLRRKTQTLVSEADYFDYLESMSINSVILLPREALDTIDEGLAAGVINAQSSFVKEARADAAEGLADDEKNGAAREKKAIASNNGNSILSVADVALNYGNFARAIELYDLAAAAGADTNLTNMRKGIALYEMGNMDAAKAAFGAVTGMPHKDIAGYWLLLIESAK
jgi:tetratricopeptide (TPR) repeat protein